MHLQKGSASVSGAIPSQVNPMQAMEGSTEHVRSGMFLGATPVVWRVLLLVGGWVGGGGGGGAVAVEGWGSGLEADHVVQGGGGGLSALVAEDMATDLGTVLDPPFTAWDHAATRKSIQNERPARHQARPPGARQRATGLIRRCVRVTRWWGGGGCRARWAAATGEWTAAATPEGQEFRGGALRTPRVTFRRVVVPLRGPGQSPVLPSACCVGSVRSVGCCGGAPAGAPPPARAVVYVTDCPDPPPPPRGCRRADP